MSNEKGYICGYCKYRSINKLGDESKSVLLDDVSIKTTINSTPVVSVNVADFFTSGAATTITSSYNPPDIRSYVTVDGGNNYAIANMVFPNPIAGEPPVTIQFIGIIGSALTVNQAQLPEFVIAAYNADLLPIASFSGAPSTDDQRRFDAFTTSLWYCVFLYENFNRIGVFNKSTAFIVLLDVPIENAFWNGHYMTYGRLTPPTGNQLTTIDIVGHETGHGVVDAIGSNFYEGESGAINEAICDIFGASFEKYFDVKTGRSLFDWTIGEVAFTTPIRDFSDPNVNNLPKYTMGNFWLDTSDPFDFGGVHSNMGVIMHWFYLCVNGSGGAQTNDFGLDYNITGPLWDMFDLLKLIYFSYSNSLGSETFKPLKFEANFNEFMSTLKFNFKEFATIHSINRTLLDTMLAVADAVNIGITEYIRFDAKKFKNGTPYYIRTIERPKTNASYIPKKRVNIFSLVTQPDAESYQPRKFPRFLRGLRN